jgi:hypothetical protein
MEKMEIFQDKVVCPRCNDGGGGFIYKVKLSSIDKIVYICDECEALWEDPIQISQGFLVDFPTYVEQYGYTYDAIGMKKIGMQNIDYYWYSGPL